MIVLFGFGLTAITH
ncbi:hypothetical protein [Photobacterium sp. TLY01]